MIIGTNVPNWNKDAAGLLKRFLDSTVGKVFLAQLGSLRPSLSGGLTVDEVALKAKLVEGYEKCIDNLLYLTESPKNAEEHPGNYPPLDEDKFWVPLEISSISDNSKI